MSIAVMTRVWNNSKQSGSKLLILLALADHTDVDGVCWPGIKSLAFKARIGERQARYNLRELEKAGEIYVNQGVGRTNTSRYFVTVGLDQKQIATTLAKHPELALPPLDAELIATGIVNGKGEPEFPISEKEEKGQSHDEKGAIPRHKKGQPTAPESSCESPSEPSVKDPLSPKGDGREKSLTGKNKLAQDLLEYFSELTCLSIPEPKTTKQGKEFGTAWKRPILAIAKECDFDLERTRALIRWTIQTFDAKNLALKSPLSIQGIACAEQARRLRAQQHATDYAADAAQLNAAAEARLAAEPEPTTPEAERWAAVKEELRSRLDRPTWETYIKPTEALEQTNGTLRVRAPSAEVAEWNSTRLSRPIAAALAAVADGVTIEFVEEDK